MDTSYLQLGHLLPNYSKQGAGAGGIHTNGMRLLKTMGPILTNTQNSLKSKRGLKKVKEKC